MTRLRAKLVNTHSLAAAARSLDLGDCLFLGRGEERSGGRRKPSLLADGFEALVGALFLDGGIRAARRFVWNVVTEGIDASLDGVRARSLDPKTALQEHAQGRGWALPVYRIADAEGPDHARRYRVEVLIEGEVMGEGRGSSKKRGEQAAASAALARLERSEDEDERER
jgi:ribonuclease-3